MNFEKLYALQKNLDDFILSNHSLKKEDILKNKTLALQVELGELANETKCFKYWSVKPSSSKNIVLEEYVDCIHFILSIGLDCNFIPDELIVEKDTEDDTVSQFLNIFIDINDLILSNYKNIDTYLTLFKDFLALGYTLNFSDEEIEEFYCKKNEVNIERQKNYY